MYCPSQTPTKEGPADWLGGPCKEGPTLLPHICRQQHTHTHIPINTQSHKDRQTQSQETKHDQWSTAQHLHRLTNCLISPWLLFNRKPEESALAAINYGIGCQEKRGIISGWRLRTCRPTFSRWLIRLPAHLHPQRPRVRELFLSFRFRRRCHRRDKLLGTTNLRCVCLHDWPGIHLMAPRAGCFALKQPHVSQQPALACASGGCSAAAGACQTASKTLAPRKVWAEDSSSNSIEVYPHFPLVSPCFSLLSHCVLEFVFPRCSQVLHVSNIYQHLPSE